MKGFLLYIVSDDFLFWLLQGLVLSLAVIAFVKKIGIKPNPAFKLTRARGTIVLFYNSYLAINALLLGYCLSVDVADGYKIIFGIIDTAFPAYICLYNRWSRNKLLGWIIKFENDLNVG
ncbi:MAG: hypothetical protein NTY50_06320 [Methylobacter sp.]|nr:hypothetical protein [Methylobacter sp.]